MQVSVEAAPAMDAQLERGRLGFRLESGTQNLIEAGSDDIWGRMMVVIAL